MGLSKVKKIPKRDYFMKSKLQSKSERFDAIRKDLKLNVPKMAKFLGVGRSTYFRYRSGETELPESIRVIFRLSGYDDNWLDSGFGKMKLEDSEHLVEMQKKLKLLMKLDTFEILPYIERLPEDLSHERKKQLKDFFAFFLSQS